MWKAEISFASVKVPVRLYAAVEDTKIHFRLLHAKDLAPVKQEMVDPTNDEVVPRDSIRRGVELEKGVFVVLTEEERAALEPEPSRQINVEQVLERGELDERWFDRPYYLGPDGDDDDYFALVQALESRGWLAIARWVMRKKRYAGALFGADGYLRLETLRYSDEIVQLSRLAPPSHRQPDKREIALAEQLIGTLEDKFKPGDFRDEHREQVMQLIRDKQRGRSTRMPKAAPAKKSDGSLREHLEASLKAAHG
jgi:DNA end-binding protein Ku